MSTAQLKGEALVTSWLQKRSIVGAIEYLVERYYKKYGIPPDRVYINIQLEYSLAQELLQTRKTLPYAITWFSSPPHVTAKIPEAEWLVVVHTKLKDRACTL